MPDEFFIDDLHRAAFLKLRGVEFLGVRCAGRHVDFIFTDPSRCKMLIEEFLEGHSLGNLYDFSSELRRFYEMMKARRGAPPRSRPIDQRHRQGAR